MFVLKIWKARAYEEAAKVEQLELELMEAKNELERVKEQRNSVIDLASESQVIKHVNMLRIEKVKEGIKPNAVFLTPENYTEVLDDAKKYVLFAQTGYGLGTLLGMKIFITAKGMKVTQV